MNDEKRSEQFRSDPTDPRHGTGNGYRNMGCRCARCRAANTEDMRAKRAAWSIGG